jgi:very-short-patch-repair endonuclease
LTERIRDDEIAQRFVERYREASEPFFVKNLENVQGDERDVIFISVTYGRDQNGNLFQRFGPINQAQGPRRLNVLFTRAKHKMVVFSSIDPDEIRIDASSSRGIVVLKGYLNYAKTGRLDTESFQQREPASDFEIAVANALTIHGFECVPQIGVAGFFIDLGVRHPEKPGTFILGIECDGASYHSAKSARDRDRLRQMILENLGWSMHRIWSTDWFKDSRREIEKVVEHLGQILAGEKSSARLNVKRPDSQGTGDAEQSIERPATASGSVINDGRLGNARTKGEKLLDAIFDEPIDARANRRSDQGRGTTATGTSGSLTRSASPENGGLTSEEARAKLIQLREDVIKRSFPNVDSSRGLLRKTLLDAFLRLKPTTREEWLANIPYDLRSTTDAEEVGKYLEAVLEIVSMIS